MNAVVVCFFVPDVERALAWYVSLGFAVTTRVREPGCGTIWAQASLHGATISFSPGGERRRGRGAKVFLEVPDVDGLFARLPPGTAVAYPPTDQFYDRRDFEIDDPDGFTLVFGMPIPSGR